MADDLEKMLPPTTLERAQPLYFLGDSHAVLYRHLRFEAGGGYRFLCLGKHLALTCENILTPSGELHDRLMEALVAENLVTRGPDGPAVGTRAEGAVLVLCCGEIELRTMTEVFGPDADFIDPEELGDPADPHKRLIPFDLICAELARRASRLGAALDRLRALGLIRLYVHALPPEQPGKDRQAGAPWEPSPLRRRLTALFHRLVRAECARRGAGFIDVSERVTREGALLPEYFLDGIHLHPRATQFSIEHLLADCLGLGDVHSHGRARPLYFVGDASVECFRDLIHIPDGADAAYACKVHVIAGFSFRTAVDEQGQMCTPFMRVLDSESMLLRDMASGELFAVRSAVGDGVFRAIGSAEDPPIIVACGSSDVERLRSLEGSAACSDAALRELVEPLIAGLALLQGAGFERIALLGIASSGADAAQTALRERLNTALEQQARSAGLRFIAPAHDYDDASILPTIKAILA